MKNSGSSKINKGFDIETPRYRTVKKKEKEEELWLNPLLYNVGIYLMAPILLGVFIGYSLDKFFKTKPIFVVFFIILGTISSYYNFWKIVKK
jgi:ATP synthase protein I